MEIKTLTPNLKRDPSIPTGVWDPSWNDPKVAIRVAADAYVQTLYGPEPMGDGLLIDPESLPDLPAKSTEARTFALERQEVEGTGFKGGAFGEIFRRYTYGGAKPAVNFHAQAVLFGADAEGRFFLRARVGRVDGGWGNAAALVVTFLAKGQEVGGLLWEGELDPPKDVEILFKGQDPALKDAFADLDKVEVRFFTKPS